MGAAERGYPRPELPSVTGRAVSSAGRAPALHAGGRRFESCTAHFAVNSPVGLAQPCLAPHAIDVGTCDLALSPMPASGIASVGAFADPKVPAPRVSVWESPIQ